MEETIENPEEGAEENWPQEIQNEPAPVVELAPEEKPSPPPSPLYVPVSPPVTQSPQYSKSSKTGSKLISPIKSPVKEDAKTNNEKQINDVLAKIEPEGKRISDHVDQLAETVKKITNTLQPSQSPVPGSNIEKIANMSKILTEEANALRHSIKTLSEDINRTKVDLGIAKEEDATNFPYHLFLLEVIVNKISMKCECFDMTCHNLVISATFLGKSPIVLYDSSYGQIDDFTKLNVGKSTLFAMTYDKICGLNQFEILLEISKQPPCTHCVTKICETRMDYTNEFIKLREDLCKQWYDQQPNDYVLCSASTPLVKNQYFLTCGDKEKVDPIGAIEVSVRMSFLGKEITTAYTPKKHTTSMLMKENNGITMYSCHQVEMDGQGKILLDEDVLRKKYDRCDAPTGSESPVSRLSHVSSVKPIARYEPPEGQYGPAIGNGGRYDEILTKMNANELKIRVPKSTKVERVGRYQKMEELCTCDENPYNTGEQIQFDLPNDQCQPGKSHNTFSSNLVYTYKGCDRKCEKKDAKKIVNVTPTNCPVPLNVEKVLHPQKDVFILKIGKKLETKDKKTDLEIELVTPKLPDKSVDNASTSQQVSMHKITKKKSQTDSTSSKGKGKKGKKGKGGKGGKKKKGKK